MKTLTLLSIFLFSISYSNPKRVLLKKVTIGKFSYSIYNEKMYQHDDNWHSEFFTVYLNRAGKRVCSAYKSAKRNDSIFIKGSYSINNNKIMFSEHYYFNKTNPSTDSIKTIFSPNEKGKLILREYIEFKQGQEHIEKY